MLGSRFTENVLSKNKISLAKRYSSCFNSFLEREILLLVMIFFSEKRLPSNLKNYLSTLTTEDRLNLKTSLVLTSVKTQLIPVIIREIQITNINSRQYYILLVLESQNYLMQYWDIKYPICLKWEANIKHI